MSSFYCETCGEPILDTPTGYITGCEHYPLERHQKKKGGRKKYSIEYKIKDCEKDSCFFGIWSEWKTYRRYKTQEQRDKALNDLSSKDKLFTYRKGE